MKNLFKIDVIKFKDLQEIPNARATVDYISLLKEMDFEDTAAMNEDEIKEMCFMSLQDLGAVDAAKLVLKHDFGQTLKEGQINNLANEMLDEKLWEEYADPALHERFFNTGSILFNAFPKEFPTPDAISIDFEISALNDAAKKFLVSNINEASVLRVLLIGMSEDSVLRRVYGDQIAANSFKSSESIIWTMTANLTNDEMLQLNIISSGYWFDNLKSVNDFEATIVE